MTPRSRQPANTRQCKRRNPLSPRVVKVLGGGLILTRRNFLWATMSNGLLVSDPPSQPKLGGFRRSHFHDNLCTLLDEYVRAEVSFANLGVREEARALVEQGGTVTRGGWRVQWQNSYRLPLGFCTSVRPGHVRRARASWKWGGGGTSRPRH